MTQKMCDKAVYAYPSTTKFFPECYKDQEMCNKVAIRCFFLFFISFLIDVKLKKCMTELFLRIFF